MRADRGRAPTGPPALLETLRATAARHHLLAPGDRVVVAVSGGADSVALLHALTLLRAEQSLALTVCHVHHGLRPEADADAAFVRALAERLGCPALVEGVTVPLGTGRSPEDAARVVRHGALARAARAVGAQRIALGHTADDQVETVLMRFLQGAGPRGLAGMPVRRGRLVRPLLESDRAAVLAHLDAHGLRWVEDASNRDRRYLRNRVRHELLPLLSSQAGPRVPDALRRVAHASRETVEALDALLAPRLRDLVRPGPTGVLLALAVLGELPPGAAKALLRLALTGLAPGPAGLRAAHLTALHALLAARPGARVRLPAGVVVERARDGLWVTGEAELVAAPVVVPGETRMGDSAFRLVADLVEVGGSGLEPVPGPPPSAGAEVWFDAEALPGPLWIRPRGAQGSMVPFGQPGPVRLRRLLAAAGTARLARASWPVLVAVGPAGDEVLWLVGIRRGAGAPVSCRTRVVLRVRAAWARAGRAPGFPDGTDV